MPHFQDNFSELVWWSLEKKALGHFGPLTQYSFHLATAGLTRVVLLHIAQL